MRLPPLPSVSDIVRLYKLSAAKKLSQNFILDMGLNRKIVAKAGDLDGYHVCEVGPGPGGITRAILEQNVEHLHVIEKDKRFFPGLQMLSDATGKLTSYHGDCLRFDMDTLFPEDYIQPWSDDPPKLNIIGNLPFSVSIPLMLQYLEAMSTKSGAWRYGRTKLTLTFQKEVAIRMAAPPGREYRCRLSVDTQNWCHVNLKLIIPGRAFVPPPDVDVGVVQLIPRKKPQIDLPYDLIVKVNRHLFHYRNKFISKSLGTLFPKGRDDLLDELIRELDLHPHLRSFNLNHEEIGRICHAYQNICARLPYIYDFDYRDQRCLKKYSDIRKLELESGYASENASHDSDMINNQLGHDLISHNLEDKIKEVLSQENEMR